MFNWSNILKVVGLIPRQDSFSHLPTLLHNNKIVRSTKKNHTFWLIRPLRCKRANIVPHITTMFSPISDEQVLRDVRRITGESGYTPSDPKELASRVLVTCYMGTVNSSVETYTRAKNLAEQIGRWVSWGGGGVLTLSWYMCMCLPFRVLFCEIWYSDRWVFIRDEGAQII